MLYHHCLRQHWCCISTVSDSTDAVSALSPTALMLYQHCLRHHWYSISTVSGSTNAVSALSPTPLMLYQHCLRHHLCKYFLKYRHEYQIKFRIAIASKNRLEGGASRRKKKKTKSKKSRATVPSNRKLNEFFYPLKRKEEVYYHFCLYEGENLWAHHASLSINLF
jgi:hypothetical protein